MLQDIKIGINQPYLFPYQGYFDLIAAVDKFVVLDDAKYMKAHWVNRNYFPGLFTFQLKKHSDYAQIRECYFFDIEDDKRRFRRKFRLKADKYLDLLFQEDNLAVNNTRTLEMICRDLGVTTPFFYASEIPHGKFIHGILDIVRALDGNVYVNLPGGKFLYNQNQFGEIKLEFIETVIGPSVLCEICET